MEQKEYNSLIMERKNYYDESIEFYEKFDKLYDFDVICNVIDGYFRCVRW